LLGDKTYQSGEVQSWTGQVSEEVVTELKEVNSNFKYCVTCVIMQKANAGLHISSTCFWDCNTDGSLTVKWENDTMYCIVNVFGLSF
jgi:dynein light chain Tctex-type 1